MNGLIAFGYMAFVLWLTGIAAYCTHMWWAINLLLSKSEVTAHIVLAVAGIFPPIGIVHGVIIWFS